MTHERSDIQGNILRGYKHMHHCAYLFCRIEQVGAARTMLKRLCDESAIQTDRSWTSRSHVHDALNVAFTYPGLTKLGWGDEFGRFEDFREGMAARGPKQLRDVGVNHPDGWQSQLREGADILFSVYGVSPDRREQRLSTVRSLCLASGLSVLYCQVADAIRNDERDVVDREHFHFADGFSQPALAISDLPPGDRSARGEGAVPRTSLLNPRPRWRTLRLGEFLLGHEDEDRVKAGGSDRHGVLRNGTFMVWRKLEQDVALFESWLETAGRGADERRLLEAKVVGRWRDGTSLVMSAFERPRPGGARRAPRNDFDYGEDPHGVACPIGAHVRRANPRTSLKWGTERSKRHRIIRRGLPYDEGAEGGRGLAFVCFNASIERQFELIQGRWLMDGDAFGLGGDQDVLLGHDDPAGKFTIAGDGRHPAMFLRRPDRPFVRTLGGYYLFVPGLAGLRLIAGGGRPGARLRVAADRLRRLAAALRRSGCAGGQRASTSVAASTTRPMPRS